MNYLKLPLVSAVVVEQLFDGIEENLERYLSGAFTDLAEANGWEIRSTLAEFDPDLPAQLTSDAGPEAEARNSEVVYQGLPHLTPALARQERVWVRLCHIECLDYARARWLSGWRDPANMVRLHFFASGLPQCRDDNALGRLWWNAHIARIASPDDPARALRQILRKADIRLNLVDRADSSARAPLARGILRALESEPWLHSHEQAFRQFMLAINRNGGGLLFEALADEDVDRFLSDCVALAKSGAIRAA